MSDNLNADQRTALGDYTGEPVKVERLDGEPSTPRLGRFPVRVTMSTGWVVKLGQFGGVLDESAPANPQRLTRFDSDGAREPGPTFTPIERHTRELAALRAFVLLGGVDSGFIPNDDTVALDTGRVHGPVDLVHPDWPASGSWR